MVRVHRSGALSLPAKHALRGVVSASQRSLRTSALRCRRAGIGRPGCRRRRRDDRSRGRRRRRRKHQRRVSRRTSAMPELLQRERGLLRVHHQRRRGLSADAIRLSAAGVSRYSRRSVEIARTRRRCDRPARRLQRLSIRPAGCHGPNGSGQVRGPGDHGVPLGHGIGFGLPTPPQSRPWHQRRAPRGAAASRISSICPDDDRPSNRRGKFVSTARQSPYPRHWSYLPRPMHQTSSELPLLRHKNRGHSNGRSLRNQRPGRPPGRQRMQ